MKSSYLFLSTTVILLLLPGLVIKLNLYNKYQKKEWESHSARNAIPMEDFTQINITGIQIFRYEYSDTASVIHFNEEIAGSRFNIEKVGNEFNISLAKQKSIDISKNFEPFKIKFDIIETLMNSYNQYRIMELEKPKEFLHLLRSSSNIVFKGRSLPKIVAKDSNLFIDTIGEKQSFDMDLDFSKCNWENFKKFKKQNQVPKATDIDRSLTNLWRIDTPKMKLKTGTFYFNKDLKFKHISIDASHKADLHFESDDYSNADISVDTTVLLRAPYSIWKNLKIIEKK